MSFPWLTNTAKSPFPSSSLPLSHSYALHGFCAMGLSISSLFSSLTSLVRWSKDQDVRILMLGLDSAGKVCACAT